MVVLGLTNSQRRHLPDGQAPSCLSPAATDQKRHDDLSRNVFGIMGIPVDGLDLETLLERIDAAVQQRTPFLLSTPNVNFLMMSRSDQEFRESLLRSDICPPDGMPVVWMARLLGVPIQRRVSGADIFDALRSRHQLDPKLKVFLFGGADGVADRVARSLNVEAAGMACVGVLNPGFGSIEEMSTDEIFQKVNSSNADLLTIFLSARKAQGWLLQNHYRVEIPVRAQFGATINLQAGSVRRAPPIVRRVGFEWLWRIKEEPYLWKRYWKDGFGLLRLVATRVVPLAATHLWRGLIGSNEKLVIERNEDDKVVGIKLYGPAIARHVDAAITCFRGALDAQKAIVIDMSQITMIDPRFFGLLLMLRKRSTRQGSGLDFVNASARVRRMFRLNGFEFLLNAQSG
jgi:N-acetylglucosaminyldiphosphoundecaprenol N-acetyl-beta-D-mannosaminyltransferase